MPRREASEPPSDDEEPAPTTYPTNLIGRVLQESFENPNTRMSPNALAVITEYLRIYTREAIWRASQEKTKAGVLGGTVAGSGLLEVEDLEKITASLTLDFS
jgi:hypothetical protein